MKKRSLRLRIFRGGGDEEEGVQAKGKAVYDLGGTSILDLGFSVLRRSCSVAMSML